MTPNFDVYCMSAPHLGQEGGLTRKANRPCSANVSLSFGGLTFAQVTHLVVVWLLPKPTKGAIFFVQKKGVPYCSLEPEWGGKGAMPAF